MQRPASPPSVVFNWRLLAAAGAVVLLIALWARPADPQASHWDDLKGGATAAETQPEAAPETPAEPRHLSVVDLIGKVSLSILLVYGAVLGLAKLKMLNLAPRAVANATETRHSRLQLRETLSLGGDGPVLYLVEVESQLMLVGAAADQMQLLWQAPPEVTSSFSPVTVDQVPDEPEGPFPVLHEASLSQRGFGAPARRETDWARERSQLISALMQSE